MLIPIVPSLSQPAARTLSEGASVPAAPVRTGILSVAAFVPDEVISNADLERMVDTSDRWILERTGIRERRRAGSGMTASVMGAEAGRRALQRAGVESPDVILVSTSSPDTIFPSTACLVQRRLGLEGMPALDVLAACSGFVYALIQADALIRTGGARTALVVASEAMTTLVDYTDRSTCVLFGDAAAAVVLGAAERGIVASRWGADGGEADLIYYGPGTTPDQADNERLRMSGQNTFRSAVERICAVGEGLCADAGWTVDDVDLLVPHQANLRIVQAAAKRFEIPSERVVWNGDRFGNTSSASIPVALAEAEAAGRLHDGTRMLLIAFGAGSTWGGVALEHTVA